LWLGFLVITSVRDPIKGAGLHCVLYCNDEDLVATPFLFAASQLERGVQIKAKSSLQAQFESNPAMSSGISWVLRNAGLTRGIQGDPLNVGSSQS
jgi:hypothetical protein